MIITTVHGHSVLKCKSENLVSCENDYALPSVNLLHCEVSEGVRSRKFYSEPWPCSKICNLFDKPRSSNRVRWRSGLRVFTITPPTCVYPLPLHSTTDDMARRTVSHAMYDLAFTLPHRYTLKVVIIILMIIIIIIILVHLLRRLTRAHYRLLLNRHLSKCLAIHRRTLPLIMIVLRCTHSSLILCPECVSVRYHILCTLVTPTWCPVMRRCELVLVSCRRW